MFTKMGIGTKIGLAFGLLIVVSVCLGGLAAWTMKQVSVTTAAMENKQVPAARVANEIERGSLKTMYNVRGYTYTEEKHFLEDARSELALVKQSLGRASELANKEGIEWLKKNTDEAAALVTGYEKLLDGTVQVTDAMAVAKAGCDEAAERFVKACSDYLTSQDEQFQEDIKALTGSSAGSGTTSTTTNPGTQGAQPASQTDEERLNSRRTKVVLVNEILNACNAIRIGNWKSQARRDPKLFEETQKKFEDIYEKLDELKATTKKEVNLKQIEECRTACAMYSDSMSAFLKSWLAREELNKERRATAEKVLLAAQTTAATGMDQTTRGASDAGQSLTFGTRTMTIGLGFVVVVGILLGWLVSRIVSSVTNPIREVIAGMTRGADQVASASSQVAQSSQSMAEGASEQASSLEETSASLEEVASMTRQNADNATQCNHLMAEAKETIDGMGRAMDEMSTAISDIKRSADQTAKIIKTIDEIAFQTNLLALNAAVEAARAGDAGKGFAVVAEEVRNLAQRSAEAAKQTAALLDESQRNAENGVQVSTRVAESLQKTIINATKVAQLISEIAAASTEQAQGIEQVNTAVSQMDKVTQANAANSEEAASASEELSAQARELTDMVATLASIVGGGNGVSNKKERSPISKTAVSSHGHGDLVRERRGAPAPKTKALMTRKTAGASPPNSIVRPEEVIPLNDSELEDF